MILVLVSCSLKILDEEGWEIYQFGWTLDEGDVLIQSHDGYRIGENIFTEHIVTPPVTVENVLGRTIDVKITRSSSAGTWVEIGPYSNLEVH
jgi:hypothetical protein